MSATGYLTAVAEKRKLTRAERDELTFVNCFLDATRYADTLRKMHQRRNNTFTAEWDALWSGMYSLQRDAERAVSDARDSGQLLFCFEGTTVLQGGAA